MSTEMDAGAESPTVLATFLARFLADEESGGVRALEDYQALFPGHEGAIAREYAQLVAVSGEGLESRSASSAALVDAVGPYRVLRELGRGGQSIVYLAEDPRLGRKVALKILPATWLASEKARERFRREAELAAKLEHPGVCVIHDTGEHDGMPWIAMRYIEGETLAAHIETARSQSSESAELSFVEIPGDAAATNSSKEGAPGERAEGPVARHEIMRIARLIEQAARALHAAHEAGLLHRDVKPGNILVAESGEPVLVDFGLARDEAREGRTLTLSGDLMGTPAYMSPEQLLAQRIRLDRRSDVYSLGVTLYECLTLTRPFDAPTREGLYQQILAAAVPDPRRINPHIPRDLQVVIETALEKDRNRRYGTALEFAEDLRRVREYEPILARPAGALLRLRRWARRNPALATATACIFVALVAGLFVVLHFLRESEAGRDRLRRVLNKERWTRQKLHRSVEETATALAEKSRALGRSEALRLAAHALQAIDEDPERAVALGMEATERSPEPLTRQALISALSAAAGARPLPTDEDLAARLRFLPSGRLMTIANFREILIWDVAERAIVQRIEVADEQVQEIVVAPDGEVAAVVGQKGLKIWSLETGRCVHEIGTWEGGTHRVGFSADSRFLAVAEALSKGAGRVTVHDLEHGREVLVSAIEGAPWSPSFSPTSDRLAVPLRGGGCLVWQLSDGTLIHHLRGADGIPWPEAFFTPDGGRIAMTGRRGLHVWNLSTGDRQDVSLPEVSTGMRFNGYGATRSRGGRRLLTSTAISASLGHRMTQNGPVCLWDLEEGHRRRGLGGEAASDGALSADGHRVAVAVDERDLAIYDAATDALVTRMTGPKDPITAVALNEDGSLVATVHEDDRVRLWPVGGCGLIPEHPRVVDDLILLPGGDEIAVLRKKRGIEILDAATLEPRRFLPVAKGSGNTVSSHQARHLDADTSGQRFVAAIDMATIAVIDATTGEETLRRSGNFIDLEWLRLLHGGRRLLIQGALGAFDLLDAASGERIATVAARPFSHAVVSPDGRSILAPRPGGRSAIIDAATGDQLWSLDAQVGDGGAFSRDGRLLVTHAALGDRVHRSGRGGSEVVPLWDTEKRALRTRLEGHEGPVGHAAFSPDGRFVVTSSWDRSARIWNTKTGETLHVLHGHRDKVLFAEFSSDGRRVLTASRDGTLRVWNAVDGSEQLRIKARMGARDRDADDAFFFAAFAAGDRFLVTATESGRLRSFPVDPLDYARSRGLRTLTPEEASEYGLDADDSR